jgi:hypothetical protein
MAYSSKRSQKPKNSIGQFFFRRSFQTFFLFFFALPSFLLSETFWNSDQVTTRIESAMMGNKSRKTKTRICGGGGGIWAQGCSKGMAVVTAESVVAESVVAVVITESVVAESVVTVTRTRNFKGLDLKPALDTTMQTRIQ